MKRALHGVVFCLAVSLSADLALADYPSGNELFEHLSTSEKDPNYVFEYAQSYGFIIGVTDALVYYDEVEFPGNTTNGQVLDVVRLYLERHPESRHKPAVILVREALMKAFPAKPRK